VLLVLTRRPFPRREDVDALVQAVRARHVAVMQIELAPLAHREMGRLVRAFAPLDDPGVDQVVAVADGNPLLAIEAARAVAPAGRHRSLARPPRGRRGGVRPGLARLDRRDTRGHAEAWIARAKWERGSLCNPLGVRDAAGRGTDRGARRSRSAGS
jgi:hypothetical protein